MQQVIFALTLPVFRCSSDEEIFYKRLSEISGLTKVVETDTAVRLFVGADSAYQAEGEIEDICAIWHCTQIVCC